jgi:hypothetical protein
LLIRALPTTCRADQLRARPIRTRHAGVPADLAALYGTSHHEKDDGFLERNLT